MKYFVKEKQYENLKKVFEELDEFQRRVTNTKDIYELEEIGDWDELELKIGFSAFSEALRDLVYLIEDIASQEIINSQKGNVESTGSCINNKVIKLLEKLLKDEKCKEYYYGRKREEVPILRQLIEDLKKEIKDE